MASLLVVTSRTTEVLTSFLERIESTFDIPIILVVVVDAEPEGDGGGWGKMGVSRSAWNFVAL